MKNHMPLFMLKRRHRFFLLFKENKISFKINTREYIRIKLVLQNDHISNFFECDKYKYI